MTIRVKMIILIYRSDQPIEEGPHQLRGFFAQKFNDFSHIHQHYQDKLIYRYPLIQYKKLSDDLVVLGINEGAELLQVLYDQFTEITLGKNSYTVYEREMQIKETMFGVTDQMITYEFITPWFCLNQKNYLKFYEQTTLEGRNKLLARVLTGNLLSISKTLDYWAPTKITCRLNTRTRKERMKETTIIGFTGRFTVNFIIPDYFGIGKSVSRGFGVIQRVQKGRE